MMGKFLSQKLNINNLSSIEYELRKVTHPCEINAYAWSVLAAVVTSLPTNQSRDITPKIGKLSITLTVW